MNNTHKLALAATNALRATEAFKKLPVNKQRELDESLNTIESSLGADPYAMVFETPLDLQHRLSAGQQPGPYQSGTQQQQTPSSQQQPAKRQPATEVIGGRVAETLEAVDFPGFISSLVTGTFQAIVDATIQQLHEYADLIKSLSLSVNEFARQNVTVGQARQRLFEKHNADLQMSIPGPGEEGTPHLIPRENSIGESPQWLADYGLEGESLTEELVEGPLLEASRLMTAEDRLQMLASMVLMGINRIVVNKGHIRAKMQFHAVARDLTTAEIANIGVAQLAGISRREGGQQAIAARVSTVKANVQADAGIKADLMGEVHIEFGSETFPLERFADTGLIEVITRHAQWRPEAEKVKTNSTGGERTQSQTEKTGPS